MPEDRVKKVRQDITNLKTVVTEMAISIYNLQLTDEEISAIVERILKVVSDEINKITVERVKQVSEDLIVQKIQGRVKLWKQSQLETLKFSK